MTVSVCVLGLGYIGLPTSVVLARAGFSVVGVDINQSVVNTINSGDIHIFEPDLQLSVASVVSSGMFTAQLTPCISDVFIVAVPTPFVYVDNNLPQPNIDFVLSAAQAIGPLLRKGNLVILESTSPVGTTQLFGETLCRLSGLTLDQFHVAYCPERVLPGVILKELVSNDRVIGGLTPVASSLVSDFYSKFCFGGLFQTNARTAEMVKLSENAFRDVNIAFANELSLVCDKLHVDVRELIQLANHHPRVNILQPGCGVGGHCIAVDPWFIASAAPDCTPLIQSARHVNDCKRRWVIDQVLSRASVLHDHLGRPPRIGCLGLSFKPDVDDLRESPAMHITTELLLAGLDVLACEPNLQDHASITLFTLHKVPSDADLLVFL